MKIIEILSGVSIAAIKIGGSIANQVISVKVSSTSATFYQISNLITGTIPNYVLISNILLSKVFKKIKIIDDIMVQAGSSVLPTAEERTKLAAEINILLNDTEHTSLTSNETTLLSEIQKKLREDERFELTSGERGLLIKSLNHSKKEVGRVYQANMLLSFALSLLSYPLIATTQNLMSLPFATQFKFKATDLTQLQSAMNVNYLMMFLSAIYYNESILFYQSKNVISVAAMLVANYSSGLTSLYLLTNYTDLEFSGILLSNAIAYSTAILVAKLIQTGKTPQCCQAYFPHMRAYALFDLSRGGRTKHMRESLTRGWLNFLAEFSINFSGAFIGLNPQINSVSLNGGLAILKTSAKAVAQEILSIASPYIAENRGYSRKMAIAIQTGLALLPPVVVTCVSIPFARPLSQALGGDSTDGLSDETLYTNTAIVMAMTFLFVCLASLYETLIDIGKTKVPGFLVTASFLSIIPLAYVFDSLTPSSQKQTVGNYTLTSGVLLSFAALAIYSYKQHSIKKPTFFQGAQSPVTPIPDTNSVNNEKAPLLSDDEADVETLGTYRTSTSPSKKRITT